MNKALKIITIVLVSMVALSGIFLTGCTGSDSASGEGSAIGQMAPDFTLNGLDGQKVSLSGFRGRPVMVNFWASWCGPCRLEMPFLQQIYEERGGEGLVLLAVNLQEDRDTVQEFVIDGGFTFPVLLSPGTEVPLAYNIRGIPATFFIDAEGVIRDIKIGAFSGVGEVESKLAKIMP